MGFLCISLVNFKILGLYIFENKGFIIYYQGYDLA